MTRRLDAVGNDFEGVDPERIEAVVQALAIEGRLSGAVPYGSGHIHDTLLVHVESGERRHAYVFQRLNTRVFPDVEALMRNLARVTGHLRTHLERSGSGDPSRRCLRLTPTRDGHSYHVDARGDAWRAFPRIEAAHSLDAPTSRRSAFAAARAFGAFATALADLPPPPLAETIPGFHDLDGRFAALQRAACADPKCRAAGARAEIEAAGAAYHRIAHALSQRGAGALPRRVVHNDCKFDNVLFDDASGEALCVVDLDTVMEGRLLHDFGDLVRTAATTAPEDAEDLAGVDFDLERFDALARGYLRGVGSLVTPAEVATLALSGPNQALENAIRFLTDHLEGDVYFRVQRPDHNLVRARAQLRLLERMLEGLPRADAIVSDAARSSG